MNHRDKIQRQDRIQEEVRKTLECFDGDDRIPLKPFFYSRLEARMEEVSGRGKHPVLHRFRIPSLRSAMVTVLIALNVVTGVWMYRSFKSQADYRKQYMESFAEELGVSQSSETNPFTI